MTETAGIKLLLAFKEPIKSISRGFKDEFLFLFNSGLSEYIDSYFEKYSKTKTFIYRDEKMEFYEIFFPVTLINRKDEQLNTRDNLDKLFSKRRFITIIGSAGSGKSMLMKHLFLSAVTQTVRIPIVVELRHLNDFKGSLFDYIVALLGRTKLANSEKFVDRLLLQGNFLFLLDGYDEIYSTSKNKVTLEIDEFIDTYSINTFVLTSRPGSNAESLQRFDNFYVQPLDERQINEFIDLQYKNHENRDSLERIKQILGSTENIDYIEYLSNPLLLSMFIFTFNSHPELPKYKNRFYWNVFDTLCTKHDAFTKNGFWLHERKSGLSNDDFENLLKWFSYITLLKGRYHFDFEFLKSSLSDICTKLNLITNSEDIIYDLTVSISIIIQDGTEYTFPHKSLQEYFTASLIKSLDEKQKRIIYTTRFKELDRHSMGGNMNFYKLCFEMDKQAFSRYFLIHNGKAFLNKIDDSNKLSLTKTFFKVAGFDLTVSKDHMGKFNIGSYSYNNSLNDSYLNFLLHEEPIPHFATTTDYLHIVEDLLDIIPEEKKTKYVYRATLNLYKKFNDQVYEFAEKSGIVESLQIIHKQISSSIATLEDSVEAEKLSTKDLLDI